MLDELINVSRTELILKILRSNKCIEMVCSTRKKRCKKVPKTYFLLCQKVNESISMYLVAKYSDNYARWELIALFF